MAHSPKGNRLSCLFMMLSSLLHKLCRQQSEFFDRRTQHSQLLLFRRNPCNVNKTLTVEFYSCGGICYPQPGGGCIIRLSEPLLRLRPSWELKNTLIHEMIHAWLIGRGIMEGNGGHGRHFNAKCQEINASTIPDFQVLLKS